MRRVAALALSLLLAASISGCTDAESASPAAMGVFDNYTADMRAMSGVENVSVDASKQQGRAHLSVTVSPQIATGELREIGERALEFGDEAQRHNLTASTPQLHIGESTYSYFEGVAPDQLQEQLEYWRQLCDTGVERVTFSAYRARGDEPSSTTGGADQHHADAVPDHGADQRTRARVSQAQPPRYIGVELPEASSAAQQDAIRAIERVPDPGAQKGQWGVVGLAPQTRVDYVGPEFPGADALATDAELGQIFADAPGLASIQVRHSTAPVTKTELQVFAFDPDMDALESDAAQQTFIASAASDMVDDTIRLFEQHRVPNYTLQFVSSPLADGENFSFMLDVADCSFDSADEWDELRDHYGETWLHSADPSRFRDASEPCLVNDKPVPGH